jgi:phosphatidylserine/phosphatidylglycerophosphate/cardiolipin synthase-like enzyme
MIYSRSMEINVNITFHHCCHRSGIRTRKELLLSLLASILIGPASLFAQRAGYPDFELVESIPTGTTLDNPDIRNTREVWLEMIRAAHRTLDFEEFYVANAKGEPLEEIIGAIGTAAERGVQVRFIVDSRMHTIYPETVDSLGRLHGISVRVIDFGALAGGIQHAKFFVVDGVQVFVGSQNFDWRALNQIHELGVRIRNRETAKICEDLFDLDWRLAKSNDRSNIDRSLRHLSYPVPIRIVEGPGDTLEYQPTCSPLALIPDTALWDETAIVHLIDAARQSVFLQFLTYSSLTREHGTYEVLNNALERAARRGVDVRLIVSDWEKTPSQVEQLRRLASVPGISVKFSDIPDLPDRYISFARVEHCKYIVADSSSCWIGSSNAEKSYFYNVRNVGVVVWNTKVAGRVRQIFLKDWGGPYTEALTREGAYAPKEHGEKH